MVFVSQKIGKTKVNKLCNVSTSEMKLAKLRSELEEKMYKDYPDKATTKVFF